MLYMKDMPLDQASGSNGFNGLFYKKCWQSGFQYLEDSMTVFGKVSLAYSPSTSLSLL